jgi:hypothetical protein
LDLPLIAAYRHEDIGAGSGVIAKGKYWTPLQLHTQKRIAVLLECIAARPDLVSDGRYIYRFANTDTDFVRTAEVGPAVRSGDDLSAG